jgi:hypothetical protein
MFLTTVVRKTSQYCSALLQPSWSTQMTVLALGLVVVGNAVDEAVHEDRDSGELDPAVRGHLAGLRVARGEVPGEEGRLLGGELHREDVWSVYLAVDDGELLVGGRRRDLLGRGGHQPAHREDEVALLGDESAQVGLVVGFRVRHGVLRLDVALGGLGGLQAGPRRGVEGLVVDAAGVGHHARAVFRRGAGAAAAGRLGRGIPTRRSGERQPGRRENRNDPLATYWAQDALLPLHTATSR